jgi:FkbM family methyltransferase
VNSRKLFTTINNFLEKLSGYRLQPSSEKRLSSTREKIFCTQQISLVVDVGANIGQYAQAIRREGFDGKILSFEPTEIYSTLEKIVKQDSNWHIFKCAVSNYSGEAKLYLSSNSFLSSSLRRPGRIKSEHDLSFDLSTTAVKVETLPNLIDFELDLNNYLKIDVQGGEMDVLSGAESILHHFKYIEFESALIPLYEGESTHYTLANWLIERGFEAKQLVITHWDVLGSTISLDAIFERSDRP